MRDLTGNVPGEGGLITFPQVELARLDRHPVISRISSANPTTSACLWGYGLYVDKLGDFVKKPMAACTGREIMTEVLGHLGVRDEIATILEHAICIPCMMPFITSQFMPRAKGDRPQVIPDGSNNLAFIGQFCEQPDDVVFTVEYSIRSAQTAVYGLLGLDRKPPPVYHGKFDPRVLVSRLSRAARQGRMRPREAEIPPAESAFAAHDDPGDRRPGTYGDAERGRAARSTEAEANRRRKSYGENTIADVGAHPLRRWTSSGRRFPGCSKAPPFWNSPRESSWRARSSRSSALERKALQERPKSRSPNSRVRERHVTVAGRASWKHHLGVVRCGR